MIGKIFVVKLIGKFVVKLIGKIVVKLIGKIFVVKLIGKFVNKRIISSTISFAYKITKKILPPETTTIHQFGEPYGATELYTKFILSIELGGKAPANRMRWHSGGQKRQLLLNNSSDLEQ